MRRLDRVGGTATILVTDLVGSTAMFDRLGDEKGERVLRAHLGELRGLVRAFGGAEVKSTGDGIMAAFPAAWLASECSVAMQRSLHLRNEAAAGSGDEPLHVRIGLHSGDTTADRHDYYGIAVAVAARLCDKASPDQILVSGVTRGLVGSRGGHSFTDAGVPALKGIDEPVQAWSLEWGPGQLPPATPPGLEKRRGTLVAAGAGALVIVGLGAGALLAGGDQPARKPAPPVAGGATVRVSVVRSGDETAGASTAAEISGDGSHVVFESTGDDLSPGDTNEAPDVFHVSIEGGLDPRTLQLVSRDGDARGNGASTQPSISEDGLVVAFLSEATNLAGARDRNRAQDVFMHLVEEGSTSRVSISTKGVAANDASFEADVSGDGNYIAFTTAADNLAVKGDRNAKNDIFVRDVVAEKTNRANIQTDTLKEANRDSSDPSISSDGEFVAFASPADTLSEGDTNNSPDVFRYNRELHATVRASLGFGGEGNSNAAGASSQPSISDDGRKIAFVSRADNLVEGDASNDPDVFVYDFVAKETTLVTRAPGTPGDATGNPVISGDGRWVAFDSAAPNLVPDDRNGVRDVFVYDLETGEIVRVSVDEAGREVPEASFDPSISNDGRLVTFTSEGRLVGEDTNQVADVYLRGPL